MKINLGDEQSKADFNKAMELVKKTQTENELLKKENVELRQMLNYVL